jgi:hypothetical protein
MYHTSSSYGRAKDTTGDQTFGDKACREPGQAQGTVPTECLAKDDGNSGIFRCWCKMGRDFDYIIRKVNPMADCEQLAGELKVLEELLKQTSTEHKRREMIDRIARIKAEQQERSCLETGQAGQASNLV